LKEAEKKIILETLQATDGNKSKAARTLDISTRKIEYKLKEWNNRNNKARF
jgi:DNA-binding NtrC family response regulator